MYFMILLTIPLTILHTILIFSTSDNKTHKWIFVGLAVLSNTETSTHVPTKLRFSVALLYLNQCPLNSILSSACHFLYNLINQ